jgi:hypothetical protein
MHDRALIELVTAQSYCFAFVRTQRACVCLPPDTELNLMPREGVAAVSPPSPVGSGAALPPNTYSMDIRMPNATIPTNTTSYLCANFHLPDDKKYHMIAKEVSWLQ